MTRRPLPSSDAALQRMQRQQSAHTKPEIELRRLLHAAGLRYRVNARLPLPDVRRTADLVFPRARVAIFVDGCFWHGCPVHRTWPRANGSWWEVKLEQNVRRDRDTDRRLSEAGWVVLRIWEHEDAAEAAQRVKNCLKRQLTDDAPSFESNSSSIP